MLVSLHVKNLALIDEVEVDFQDGLNILSGETGAGKSIIIGSVNLALGAKADAGIIRNSAEYALIELEFSTLSPLVKNCMEDLDLPWEEDGSILISRKIQPAKSVFRINGETVTAKTVKTLAEYLLDIHGQHEHQSLLSKKKQMDILDQFAGAELSDLLQKLGAAYSELRSVEKELEEESKDENTRIRELELAEYEVNEIESANLQEEEDLQLESQFQKMTHARKILEEVQSASYLLSSGDEGGVETMIGRALRNIMSVTQYDETLEELANSLGEIEDLIQGFNRDLLSYADDMTFDEEEFRHVQERLDLYNHLKAKYGNSVSKILEYYAQRMEECDKLRNYDVYLMRLRTQYKEYYAKCVELCSQVTALRTKTAKLLEKQLISALADLNFLDVQFEIGINSAEENMSSNGCDDVEFLISTNPGETIRPLRQIASGGELSRIMLALKTVLADKDDIEALIFDEIDSGISGKTAWKVSEKLGELSARHQIICITHLPQIAAMADRHFYIEKNTDNNVTSTTLSVLSEEMRERELARMLGGDSITEASIQNAKDLISQAKNK